MKKKIVLLGDAGMCVLYVLFSLVMFGGEAFIFSISDSTAVRLIFSVPVAVWVGLLVYLSNQWLMIIIVSPKGVLLHPGVYKKKQIPYEYYQYVYHASYWHGSVLGIGYPRDYIVFSHESISDYLLNNINQTINSAEILKISYSSKTYQRVMNIVPPKMQHKLEQCKFDRDTGAGSGRRRTGRS